ncbi:MAG: ribose-5-phosphate isomerase A, partial [archaeon]
MLSEETVDAFITKYVKNGHVLAIGTNPLGELLLKKIGVYCEKNEWDIMLIPTSISQIQTANEFHLPLTTLNDREVDVAIEFVDQADHDYNLLKRQSYSLIRDKMIAQSAAEVIAILPESQFVKTMSGMLPFEIS